MPLSDDRGISIFNMQDKFIDIVYKFMYFIDEGGFSMSQINVNIRMDSDLKKQFEAFCSDVGMSMTTAFCIFAKTVVRQQRIPFEITTESDPFYSDANMTRLRKSIAQMEMTGGTIHEVSLDDEGLDR